jgi:hypothetical protein
MTREEVLETARKIVAGQRYGKPENNFTTIGKLWSAYLNAAQRKDGLKPQDVAAMMILLKVARIATGIGNADNWTDIAGYAACGGELEEQEGEKTQ